MEFSRLIDIRNGICDEYPTCSDCPLHIIAMKNPQDSCRNNIMKNQEEVEKIIAAWVSRHPTFLTDFLEKYPKAFLSSNGVPNEICPYSLGYCAVPGKRLRSECTPEKCVDCWNTPLKKEKKRWNSCNLSK